MVNKGRQGLWNFEVVRVSKLCVTSSLWDEFNLKYGRSWNIVHYILCRISCRLVIHLVHHVFKLYCKVKWELTFFECKIIMMRLLDLKIHLVLEPSINPPCTTNIWVMFDYGMGHWKLVLCCWKICKIYFLHYFFTNVRRLPRTHMLALLRIINVRSHMVFTHLWQIVSPTRYQRNMYMPYACTLIYQLQNRSCTRWWVPFFQTYKNLYFQHMEWD